MQPCHWGGLQAPGFQGRTLLGGTSMCLGQPLADGAAASQAGKTELLFLNKIARSPHLLCWTTILLCCCLVPCITSACLSLFSSCALHLLQRPPKSFGKGVTKHFKKLSSIEGSLWEVELVGVEAPWGSGLSSSLPGESGRGGYQATVICLGCRVGKV